MKNTTLKPDINNIANAQLPDYVCRALRVLFSRGHEAWIVGGCVRDIIRGASPADYDITTSALPEEVISAFAGYTVIETGLRHGTVTVRAGNSSIEITTYRIDGGYEDARHPSGVVFTRGLTQDLARRDFTMNAVAFSPEKGIVDPFGGADDIQSGIIRCVGEPEKRFSEDALRILRALRFSAVLGFDIEEKTATALTGLAPNLTRISHERVREELARLLCGANALEVLLGFPAVICEVIPELAPCAGFDQRNPHHIFDVYGHMARTVAACPDGVGSLRFAALLHDIGKPPCFTLDGEGRGHFRGHARKSAELADAVLTRLRFDNRTRARIVRLIELHDNYPHRDRACVRRDIADATPALWGELMALRRADSSAKAPGAYGDEEEYFREVNALAQEIFTDGDCVALSMLAVDGRDVAALGFAGEQIGRVLDVLLDRVIAGELANERPALLCAARDCPRG